MICLTVCRTRLSWLLLLSPADQPGSPLQTVEKRVKTAICLIAFLSLIAPRITLSIFDDIKQSIYCFYLHNIFSCPEQINR